jgi:hypothetical protein
MQLRYCTKVILSTKAADRAGPSKYIRLNGFLQSGERKMSEGYSIYSGRQMRDNILQHQQYFELFVAVWVGIGRDDQILVQAVRVSKISIEAPDVCGSSVWGLLHIPDLAPRILRQLLDFWNICAALLVTLTMYTVCHNDEIWITPHVIKRFTWFTLQQNSGSEIGWWSVN